MFIVYIISHDGVLSTRYDMRNQGSGEELLHLFLFTLCITATRPCFLSTTTNNYANYFAGESSQMVFFWQHEPTRPGAWRCRQWRCKSSLSLVFHPTPIDETNTLFLQENEFVIGNLSGDLAIFKGECANGLPTFVCRGLGTVRRMCCKVILILWYAV